MTEDEAKTKWCPFAKEYDSGNRRYDGAVSDSCLCLGSGCMAWRWLGERAHLGGKITAIKDHRARTGATLKEAKEFAEAHPELWSARCGYCGFVREERQP